MNFTHLHLHTKYSLLDGAIDPGELAERLETMAENSEHMDEDNLAAAITDHGNLHGAIDFYKSMRKHDINPLMGCEVYTPHDDDAKNKTTEGGGGMGSHNHLMLLARNEKGWRNLMKISSYGYLEGFYYDPRVDTSVIEEHSDGLILLTGCMQGKIPQALMDEGHEEAKRWLERYCNIVGEDNVYIEIQYHNNEGDDAIVEGCIELSEEYDLPLVTTADSHYLTEDWANASDHLVAINTGSNVNDPDAFTIGNDYWVKTPEEIAQKFPEEYRDAAWEGMENTGEIAERCDVEIQTGVHYLPEYPMEHEEPEHELENEDLKALEAWLTDIHLGGPELDPEEADVPPLDEWLENNEPVVDRSESDLPDVEHHKLRKLMKLIEDGLSEKYAEHDEERWQEAYERLENELDTIIGQNYMDYFLVVWDFIMWARHGKDEDLPGVGYDRNGEPVTTEDEDGNIVEMEGGGMMVGPGRGSAAGCFVSYLIGITKEADPIEYNLLFERFLNPYRKALPDIDVDFTRAERDTVKQYSREKYHRPYVAELGTLGKMKARSVIRDVGRVRNVEDDMVDKLAEMIPEPPGSPTIDEALGFAGDEDDKVDELFEIYNKRDDVKEYLDVCRKLEGLYRHTSTHAAGLLISPKKVDEYLPLMRDKKKGTRSTQYDMDDVKKAGGVKFDFLGLKTLDIIQQSCANVNRRYDDVHITTNDIPLEDEKALEMMGEGRTTGVFQMESDGFQDFMSRLQPQSFRDVIASIALYRPGPLQTGVADRYIECLHGRAEPEYAHPDLKPILEDTFGLVIYQEQVMQICQDLAGYTLGEADLMRRAIGKKDMEVMQQQRKMFIEGCVDNGYPQGYAEDQFEDFVNFAEYAFNKCLVSDTKITDSETGAVYTIEELYDNPDLIDETVSCETSDGTLTTQAVTDVVQNGVKPVYELTTESGKTIKATANHPFLTREGWTNLEELSEGERIGTPRELPAEGNEEWPEHKTVALAHLLSEGNLCHPSSVYYYTQDDDQLERFCDVLKGFDNVEPSIEEREKYEVYVKRTNRSEPNDLVDWIEQLGLRDCKAREKFIPDPVFELNNDCLAEFIGQLWSGDGHVGEEAAYYATSSEKLSKQLQSLLLRFGVQTNRRAVEFDYRDGTRTGYQVFVTGDDLGRFARSITGLRPEQRTVLNEAARTIEKDGKGSVRDIIPLDVKETVRAAKQSKDVTWGQVEAETGVSPKAFRPSSAESKQGYQRSTIRALGEYFDHDGLKADADSDIRWERIESIEHVGKKQTYDLTIEDTHNFVANDIIVHNSHSAAYAILSSKTAWLKAHYPTDFTAANLAVEEDQDKAADMIQDFQSRGFDIVLPSVNECQKEFSAVEDGRVSFGLVDVKNVGTNGAEEIVREREANGPYEDFEDFCERVDGGEVNRQTLEALGAVGAFEDLGMNRPTVLNNLEEINDTVSSADNDGKTLFDDTDMGITLDIREYPDWGRSEIIEQEKDLLGLPLEGAKITDEEQELLKKMTEVRIEHLPKIKKGSKVMIGGVVTRLYEYEDASGSNMAFFTIRDWTGDVETKMFSSRYSKYNDVIELGSRMIALMEIDTYQESKDFKVQSAFRLSDRDPIRRHYRRNRYRHALTDLNWDEKPDELDAGDADE